MPIRKDQHIRGRDSSGGGYGDPLTRDPARVLTDVLEGYEFDRQGARHLWRRVHRPHR